MYSTFVYTPVMISDRGKDLPATDPRLLRQLWGLAVRCERTLRVIAPHWQALSAGWGKAAERLFRRITVTVNWLCQLAGGESGDAHSSLPEPVIPLLASSVATILKVESVAGFHADFMLPSTFVNIPALRRPTSGMMHATVSLILLRMARAVSAPRIVGSSIPQGAASSLLFCAGRAVDTVLRMSQWGDYETAPLVPLLRSLHMTSLVNRASAELLHCSGLATKRGDAHFVVGTLSCYAAYLSTHIAFGASQGCDGGAYYSGSAELRDLLVRPLLHLLHSPLLDTLVALQHVMVEEGLPGLQRGWESSSAGRDQLGSWQMFHGRSIADPFQTHFRSMVVPVQIRGRSIADPLQIYSISLSIYMAGNPPHAGASICQMHLTPASRADAMDSKVVMQVGHTYYSGVMFITLEVS